MTVLEWLHRKEGYGGRVAAFGVWMSSRISSTARVAGSLSMPVMSRSKTASRPRGQDARSAAAERRAAGGAEPFDALASSGVDYLVQHKPRVLYLSLNETDAWGHEGKYHEYLKAARRVDGYGTLIGTETTLVVQEFGSPYNSMELLQIQCPHQFLAALLRRHFRLKYLLLQVPVPSATPSSQCCWKCKNWSTLCS